MGSDVEVCWLAGLLEGEGSFMPGPPSRRNATRISLSMCDEDVVARVASIWGVSYRALKKQKKHHRTPYATTVSNTKARRWMKKLRPFMGARRQRQIDNALRAYKHHPRKITQKAAEEMATRYHSGERHPTRLGKEYGISKNLAIYYINKYKPT